MGSLLPTHQTNVHIRLYSESHGEGTLDIPLAEASRPFAELRLLNSAVVTVQAAKTIKTSLS